MTSLRDRVGVVLITYRAVTLLPRSLPPLLHGNPGLRVLVVNSSSGDGAVADAVRRHFDTEWERSRPGQDLLAARAAEASATCATVRQ